MIVWVFIECLSPLKYKDNISTIEFLWVLLYDSQQLCHGMLAYYVIHLSVPWNIVMAYKYMFECVWK